MRLLRVFLHRLRSVFSGSALDRELRKELSAHLEQLQAEFEADGMDARSARQAAHRAMGNFTQQAEQCREHRRVNFAVDLGRDLIYASRQLRQSPGFALVVVLCLGLGIGANAAVFSLFHAMLLRTLPVERPEELVVLRNTGGWGSGFVSFELYQRLRDRKDLHEGLLARSGARRGRMGEANSGDSEPVRYEYVSGEYFEVLGVGAARGRVFHPSDSVTPGAHPVAVLGYDFWQRRFGGDPEIVGKQIVLEDAPFTVVGVTGRGFRGVDLEETSDLWIPVMMGPKNAIESAGTHWLWLIARQRPGVSERALETAGNLVYATLLEEVYGKSPASFRKMALGQRLHIEPGSIGLSLLREQFGQPLRVLMGAVVLVLLIACANVAGLLLARGAARQREFALRASLGAGGPRLLRQSLAESLLLGALGCAVGLAIAQGAIRGLALLLPDAGSSQQLQFGVNPSVLVFTIAISITCVVVFGCLPALQARRVAPAAALKAGGLGSTTSDRRFWLRGPLVAAQFALSIALAVLAMLFSQTLGNLLNMEPGLHNSRVLVFWINGPKSYGDEQMGRIWKEARRRFATIPGVASVALAAPGPYRMGSGSSSVEGTGLERAGADNAAPKLSEYQRCSADYLRIIGAKLVSGEFFSELDGEGVAVVNESFVRDFFGGRSPLGELVTVSNENRRIVGVIRDVRHHGLREQPAPTIYFPASDTFEVQPAFLVEANGNAAGTIPGIAGELRKQDAQLTLSTVRTMEDVVEGSVSPERMLSTLCLSFAGLAILLAAVGLYGLIAHWLARRRRELGVRLALGARSSSVAGAVLRHGLVLVAWGLAAGFPLAYIAARLAESLLFGVSAMEPLVWSICLGTLVLAACLALIPALRAALRVNPVEILRSD